MEKRGLNPDAFNGPTPVPQPPDVQQVDGDGNPIGDPEGSDGGADAGRSQPSPAARSQKQPVAPQADASGMQALAAAMVQASENQRDASAMQPPTMVIAPSINIHMSGEEGEDAEEIAERTAHAVAGAVTQAFSEIMSKPKRIVRDAKGRPVGIEHVDRIEGATA